MGPFLNLAKTNSNISKKKKYQEKGRALVRFSMHVSRNVASPAARTFVRTASGLDTTNWGGGGDKQFTFFVKSKKWRGKQSGHFVFPLVAT